MDNTILKLMCILRPEFDLAARTGKTGNTLYAIAKVMRRHVPCEVETNEGYNRLVKCVSERSPNINLCLLDARVNVKKRINVGSRGATTRWSQVRDRATHILNEAVDFGSDLSIVSVDPDRWAVPQPTVDLPNRKLLLSASKDLDLGESPQTTWACLQSLRLHRIRKGPCSIDSRIAYFIKPSTSPILNEEDLLMFIADKNYSLASLVVCKVHSSDLGVAPRNLIAKVILDPIMVVSDSLTLFVEQCSV
jgi:hypothetical protein